MVLIKSITSSRTKIARSTKRKSLVRQNVPLASIPPAAVVPQDEWLRGYYCCVMVALREDGGDTTLVRSLFGQGGDWRQADKEDVALFKQHGLTKGARRRAAFKPRPAVGEHEWLRGYYCCVAVALREEGDTALVKSLFRSGGNWRHADSEDVKLFKKRGLTKGSPR